VAARAAGEGGGVGNIGGGGRDAGGDGLSGGPSGNSGASDEELRVAVQECRELLEEALLMAGEQTRAELAASFIKSGDDGGGGGTTGNLAVDMARVQLFFQGKARRCRLTL
jgi:hypothetical protein